MTGDTLRTRIILNNKISEEWEFKYNSIVPLKGEVCIYSDLRKIKIGDGTTTIVNLPFASITPEEVQNLIISSSHSHNNKTILDTTTASFTTELLEKINDIEIGANRTDVDSSLSSTSINPVQNKVIYEELNNKVSNTITINGKPLSSNISLTYADVNALSDTLKGSINGVAELDSSGKVPIAQLPGYVDDVVEGYYSDGKFFKNSSLSSEITGETDKIYICLSSNKTFRYSGTIFVEISESLAIGETSSTAYRGDRGKIAYDHSQTAHAPSNAERNIIVGIQKNGTDVAVDSSTRKVNIVIPTKVSEFTNDSGYLTSSGTIAKANQLTNTRKIDGVNFNGTADITHYAECSTAAGTAAKTVSLTGFNLVSGARIAVKFTVTNTAASPTLNVGGTGAKAIMYRGSAISAGYLAANRIYEFIYDGTDWELVGDLDTNTTYSAGAGLTLSGTQFKHSNSITAGTAKGDDNKTLTFGGTFTIPTVTYDAQGHITGKGTTTMTMPATPTSVSGNAGSATKLATARNFSIGGAATAAAVSFNGTADVAFNVTALNMASLYVNSGDTVILNGNF